MYGARRDADREEPVDVDPEQLDRNDGVEPGVSLAFEAVEQRQYRRQQHEGRQLRPGMTRWQTLSSISASSDSQERSGR